MSLEAASTLTEILRKHVETCDVRYCDLCAEYASREWQEEFVKDSEMRKREGAI